MKRKIISTIIMIFSDISLFYIAFFLAYITRLYIDRFNIPYIIKFTTPLSQSISLLWIPITYILIFAFEGIYTKRFDFWDELKIILKAIVLSNLIIFAVVSIGKISDQISRIFLFLLAFFSIVLYFTIKPYIKKFLFMNKIGLLNVLIIDREDNFEHIKSALYKEKGLGFLIVECIDIETIIKDKIKINGIDAAIINEGSLTKIQLIKIFSKLINKVENIYILPGIREIPIMNSELEYFNMTNLLFFRIKNNLSSAINQFIKRGFDIVMSILIFPIFSIITAIIAILIKMDSPGPIFFKHERIGKNGGKIKVYKFRTMYIDAEKRLNELLDSSQELKEEWNKKRKLKDDPRITKIGKFLRKSSLDELPQIINVIKGNMSIVGPRPVLKDELEKYYGYFSKFYYAVKPGITGLWQVSGRNDLSYKKRVRLDIFYITNWSLWLDIIIITKTFKAVLDRKGVY